MTRAQWIDAEIAALPREVQDVMRDLPAFLQEFLLRERIRWQWQAAHEYCAVHRTDER